MPRMGIKSSTRSVTGSSCRSRYLFSMGSASLYGCQIDVRYIGPLVPQQTGGGKEKSQLVGLICVNHDVEDILVLSEHLSNLLHSFSLPQEEESSAYTEDLDDSIPELSSNLIHSTILGYGIPSNAMHTADKLEILRSLEAQGVFQTKGSVGQVARELHISEPTVYRYLRRIRSETV